MTNSPAPPPATLRIDHRFNGPPTSGNGGWIGGSLAVRLGAPSADVALRAPPALDTDLALSSDGPGHLALFDGDRLLAEARAADVDVDVPRAPSLERARAAGLAGRLRAAGRPNSPYSRCFACGILRADGLRITPGTLDDREGVIAADWTPPADLAAADGTVRIEAIWAALDCPAGIAWGHRLGVMQPMMTARIQLAVHRAPRVGEPCIVIGWPIAQEGRKLHAGTALFDAQGNVLARSRQLWLMPRDGG